jgi:hypothetical protein
VVYFRRSKGASKALRIRPNGVRALTILMKNKTVFYAVRGLLVIFVLLLVATSFAQKSSSGLNDIQGSESDTVVVGGPQVSPQDDFATDPDAVRVYASSNNGAQLRPNMSLSEYEAGIAHTQQELKAAIAFWQKNANAAERAHRKALKGKYDTIVQKMKKLLHITDNESRYLAMRIHLLENKEASDISTVNDRQDVFEQRLSALEARNKANGANPATSKPDPANAEPSTNPAAADTNAAGASGKGSSTNTSSDKNNKYTSDEKKPEKSSSTGMSPVDIAAIVLFIALLLVVALSFINSSIKREKKPSVTP